MTLDQSLLPKLIQRNITQGKLQSSIMSVWYLSTLAQLKLKQLKGPPPKEPSQTREDTASHCSHTVIAQHANDLHPKSPAPQLLHSKNDVSAQIAQSISYRRTYPAVPRHSASASAPPQSSVSVS